jgi:hypothetical protein
MRPAGTGKEKELAFRHCNLYLRGRIYQDLMGMTDAKSRRNEKDSLR